METHTPHTGHRHMLSTGLGKTLVVFIIIFLAAEALSAFGFISDTKIVQSSPNTISVNGTGKVYAPADIATFSYSISATASTVADAQNQSAVITNKALAFLKTNGVADADVQTTDYSVNPQYDYSNVACPAIATADGQPVYCPPSKQVLSGYQVSQTITVKVRDTTKVGDILSGIGALGVTNVSSLQFSIDNPDALQAQAQTKAIADAKTKADALAQALGVHLGKVVSFSENQGGVAVPVYSMALSAGSAKADAVPSIPTGQNTISDDVSITYEIR